ncbi:MAG: glycosyltransferase family 39 protein [Bacteroidia bacterium]|nr:glycosyltransferase family 39 protein [Bacteroidia bacterium]
MLRLKENFIDRNSGLYILLIIIFLCLLFGLGSWGLTETSESRYAEISKEMMENRDYAHPTLLGIYHYHKPPLTYQITGMGYKIFGVGEFGARFFLQFALCIQLILVYLISKLLFNDKRTAVLTAIIYFSIPLVLISIRNLTTDAYLNTTILLSIFLWLHYKSEKGKVFELYLFFISLGLIINIKGPVGLIFPLLFIISHALVYKSKLRITIHALLGLVLFVGISSIWVYLLIQDHPEMLNYFIDEQILRRVNSKSFNRAKPAWFYLVLFPLMILPWLWPMIKSIQKNYGKHDRSNTSWLSFWNMVLILLVFSLFSTKLVLYILPVCLYVAMLAADGLSKMNSRSKLIQNNMIIGLALAILSGLAILPFINEDFSIAYIPWIVVLVMFSAGIIWIRTYLHSIQTKTFFTAMLFGLALIFGSTLFFQENEMMVNSVKPIFDQIEQNEELKDRPLIVHNYLLSSAPFYCDRPVITLNYGHDTVKRDIRFQKNDQWRKSFFDIQGEDCDSILDSLFRQKPIVLVRRRGGKIESKSLFIDRGMEMIDFDKWVLFY